MRRSTSRRGEISAPIITVLLTVAALAVTGIAITWMNTAASRAQSQGSLVILGTPTVTPGTNATLFITVKNIGTASVNITQIRLGTVTVTVNQVVAAGNPSALSPTFTSLNSTAGQTYNGILITDSGTVSFTAYCQ